MQGIALSYCSGNLIVAEVLLRFTKPSNKENRSLFYVEKVVFFMVARVAQSKINVFVETCSDLCVFC